MKKTVLIYACVLAGGAFVLNWLEYRYFIKMLPTQNYIMVLAVGFTALGLWLGARLTARTHTKGFEQNTAALRSLKITKRETSVLTLLAQGQSNKEIARSMGISPNTVKTHMAHLYEKLDVSKRVNAVQKAKALQLIP
jgi:DNA-binding NarL/FixJ family response regulator